jgi:hypothetical protein
MLTRIHHERFHMLTRMERRRAYLTICGIVTAAMINALIWILR